jgi:hypothetical protein
MKYAVAEAKRWKGEPEGVIQKGKPADEKTGEEAIEGINYHKKIGDRVSYPMTSDLGAWCAAFVNWCLMQAGYPIKNPKESNFVDRKAVMGRATGFDIVHGKKESKSQKVEDVPLVDNPLFEEIDRRLKADDGGDLFYYYNFDKHYKRLFVVFQAVSHQVKEPTQTFSKGLYKLIWRNYSNGDGKPFSMHYDYKITGNRPDNWECVGVGMWRMVVISTKMSHLNPAHTKLLMNK